MPKSLYILKENIPGWRAEALRIGASPLVRAALDEFDRQFCLGNPLQQDPRVALHRAMNDIVCAGQGDDSFAMCLEGYARLDGFILPQNEEHGIALFKVATLRGSAEAQHLLGLQYFKEYKQSHVLAQLEVSLRLLKMSKNNGHSRGARSYGMLERVIRGKAEQLRATLPDVSFAARSIARENPRFTLRF